MLTAVPLCVPLFTVVLVHGWYIFGSADWSGCGALAEMYRHAASVVVEHRNEFEARTERFQILAQCRDAHVLGMLELGDRPWVTSRRPANSTWLIASPCRNS